ncbi:MAG: pepsin/retropepsin-like aspartic protease family protein [Planctomycetota bacterium]
MRSVPARLLLFALLAACTAPDNRAILDDLEEQSRDESKPALLAQIVDPQAYFIRGPARTILLPMEKATVPVVRVRINGVEMPGILDTGTTHIVLSGPAARACKLYMPESMPMEIVTPGYATRFFTGAPESVEIGGMKLEGGIALVPEKESGLARRLGVPNAVHATIGTAVLSNYNVVFDFQRRLVELQPHGKKAFAGVMWTRVRVNDKERLLLIDSGANGLFLEPDFAHELGLVSQERANQLRGKARSASEARMERVRVDELGFGPRVFRNVRAHVVSIMGDPERGGLLGLPGLGPHRWLVHYETRQFALVEPDGTTPEG